MTSGASLDATDGAIRKRKRQDLSGLVHSQAWAKAEPANAHLARLGKPARSNNKLLAGCLAHEFLTRGTLLGSRLEPSRQLAEPVPGEPYAEVSRLLMTGGAHIAGVVNPAQLARWVQIKE